MATLAELEARVAALEQLVLPQPDPRLRPGLQPAVPDPAGYANEERVKVLIDGKECVLKRTPDGWEPAFAYDLDFHTRINRHLGR